MYTDLSSNVLIKQLLELYNEFGGGSVFHKKSHFLMEKMTSQTFISYVIFQNLSDTHFLNKKWLSTEIPQLTIYEDNYITLKYHIFLPDYCNNVDAASYLIHDHGDYNLSSCIVYGDGYNTIEFDKNIQKKPCGNYDLKINKDFLHSPKCVNLLESQTPHVIFNVASMTSSIVLWTKNTNKSNELAIDFKKKPRLNYILRNGFFSAITDSEFSVKVNNDENFDDNSETHIQALCYFAQQVSDVNQIQISKLLSNKAVPHLWNKWLSFLLNKTKITIPLIDNKINTLGNTITILQIRKACAI